MVSPVTGIVTHFDLFAKDVLEPTVPYIVRADLANHRYLGERTPGDLTCSGKGLTLEAARTSALGEAVERYSGAVYAREEISYATLAELSGPVLDPRRLVPYADWQYEKLEYARFREERPIGWARAYALAADSPIWVPAISVFMDYQVASSEEYLYPVTSNGLAAGATLLQAVLAGALEVIERDAFTIGWHQQMTGPAYDPLTIPDRELVDYCRLYRRRGVELHLVQLLTDFPVHVFLAVGRQEKGIGPAAVVGLGADFDATRAARGALLEVGQVRPALRKRLRLPDTQDRLAALLNDPGKVAELQDHDLLYASPKQLAAFDFLLDQPVKPFDFGQDKASAPERLSRLVAHAKGVGSDLIYYDLTPPDMRALGIYTARAILPELQPIHFGADKIRLGGDRLYQLPELLGQRNGQATPTIATLQPHPLA